MNIPNLMGSNVTPSTEVPPLAARFASLHAKHFGPALRDAEASQNALTARLDVLDAELTRVTDAVETASAQSTRLAQLMADTSAVLSRTRRKLTTVRGRVGRLRNFENADRLELSVTASGSASTGQDVGSVSRTGEVLISSTGLERPADLAPDVEVIADHGAEDGDAGGVDFGGTQETTVVQEHLHEPPQ